jgi:Flp pilus assembly protein TadB
MPLLSALIGTGIGAGILLVAHGMRRTTPHWRRPPWFRQLSQERAVHLAACLGAAAIVGLLTRWPVGATMAGVAAWTLPRMLAGDRAMQRTRARTEAVAAWAEMLRDNLAAAAGLEQAVLASAAVAPAAIRDELAALAAMIRTGTPLPEALASFRTSLNDPTGDLVVRALSQAAHRQAGKPADLLAELADLARKRTAVRLRVAAGRAQVRTSARVVTVTTVVFAVALVALNRSYLTPYDSPTGQLVLLAIGAMFAAGFAGLNKLGRLGDSATAPRSIAGAEEPS